MRILIDEDLASRELLRRLEAVMPGSILRAAAGTSDEDVWRQAHDAGAVIVTGNVVDFVRLARDRQRGVTPVGPSASSPLDGEEGRSHSP